MTKTQLIRTCPSCAGNGRLFAQVTNARGLYPSLCTSDYAQSVVLCRACKGSGRQLLTDKDLDWQPAPGRYHYLGLAKGPRLAA